MNHDKSSHPKYSLYRQLNSMFIVKVKCSTFCRIHLTAHLGWHSCIYTINTIYIYMYVALTSHNQHTGREYSYIVGNVSCRIGLQTKPISYKHHTVHAPFDKMSRIAMRTIHCALICARTSSQADRSSVIRARAMQVLGFAGLAWAIICVRDTRWRRARELVCGQCSRPHCAATRLHSSVLHFNFSINSRFSHTSFTRGFGEAVYMCVFDRTLFCLHQKATIQKVLLFRH